MTMEKRRTPKEKASTSKEKPTDDQEEIEYVVEGRTLKQVSIAKINYSEEFDKKIRNLQIIAISMVVVISLISPLAQVYRIILTFYLISSHVINLVLLDYRD